jgi:hypothetical protein
MTMRNLFLAAIIAGLFQMGMMHGAIVDRSRFVPVQAVAEYPSWSFVSDSNMGELDAALDKASQEIQAELDADEAAIRLKIGTGLE